MFEKASRLKLRFESPRGMLSVEELWDIPLTNKNGMNLDEIAKTIFMKLRDDVNISFVNDNSETKDDMMQLKFDIIKHIIDIKKSERNAHDLDTKKKEENKKIMALIAEKQDDALKGKSIEELQAMLQS